MAKTYWLKFGPNDPRSFSGLSPTFVIFQLASGTTSAAPGITERIAGTGAYQFSFTGSSISVFFTVDGGAALSLSSRYISGVLDPVQAIDQVIGTPQDTFGTELVDPTTLTGYVKRLQEFNEGNADYLKSSGAWTISSRGSSVTLAEKTLTNSVTSSTKT